MNKNAVIGLAALALFIAANLRIGYSCTLAGAQLPGEYTKAELKEATAAAEAVISELSYDSAKLTQLETHRTLRLSPAGGDIAELTDALIKGHDKTELLCGVYVNERRLGSVRSADMLSYLLRKNIDDKLPNSAVCGQYAEDIVLIPEYCPAGSETDYGDMLLLIEGAAPIMYYNADGELA